MMGFSRSCIAIAVLASCGVSEQVITVSPGPVVIAPEGESRDIVVALPSHPGARFEVTMSDETAALFMTRPVAVAAGEVGATITVTPRCDALTASRPSGVVELTVSTPDASVEPVVITVEIQDNPADACGISAVAWLGDCTQPQPFQSELTIDVSTQTRQQLCIEMTMPDPSVETVWLSVSAPSDQRLFILRDLGEVAIANESQAGETYRHTRIVGIPDPHNYYRGRMPVAINWQTDGPGKAPQNGIDVVIVVGAPGDAVIRPVSPVPSTEYRISAANIEISHYFTKEVPCVKTSWVAPSNRVDDEHDLVRLFADNEFARIGEWLCGADTVRLEVWPPIDARATETVILDAAACDTTACPTDLTATSCCRGGGGTIGPIVATRPVNTNVVSVADEIAKAGTQSELICIDSKLDGNSDMLLRSATSMKMYTATGGRFGVAVQFNAIPSSVVGTVEEHMLGERATVFGLFGSQPRLRRADFAGGKWNDAGLDAILPNTSAPLDLWKPIGKTVDGPTTHLAIWRDATTVTLMCTSDTCNGVVNIPIIIDGSTFDAVGSADLDGDNETDLVVATSRPGPTAGTRELRLRGVILDWTTSSPTASPAFDVAPVATLMPYQTVRIVSLDEEPCDRLYVFAKGLTTAQIVETHATQCMIGPLPYAPFTTIQSLGNALGIANVSNKLIVATEIGVWEYGTSSWFMRDPQLAELAQGGVVPVADPSSTYGEHLTACIGGEKTGMAFEATLETARWTQYGIDVEAFSVGGF